MRKYILFFFLKKGSEIFDVLREDAFSVWLFRYKRTSRTGRPFAPTFTAMTARKWRFGIKSK